MKTLEEKAHLILKALLGSDEMIAKWWTSPNRAFDGQLPDDLWNTNSGRNKVYNYLLDQMEPPH
jgi:uncharacterized protein (DUF2384 family)